MRYDETKSRYGSDDYTRTRPGLTPSEIRATRQLLADQNRGFTFTPGGNENPDTTQAGSIAVTGASNTGHNSTTSSAANGSAQSKSCRWFSFTGFLATRTSMQLQVTHSSSGTLSGAGASNLFRFQYTLDGGSNWTTAVTRADFTAADGETFVFTLDATQDLSLVQVRDLLVASTNMAGENATVTGEISGIKIVLSGF